MKISQLIKKLERIKKRRGDLRVISGDHESGFATKLCIGEGVYGCGDFDYSPFEDGNGRLVRPNAVCITAN